MDFARGVLFGVSSEPLGLLFRDADGNQAIVELMPVVAQWLAIQLLRDPRVGGEFNSRVREWLLSEYQREQERDRQELKQMGVIVNG